MSATVNAPAQHKQPSRKGKRAWRKNVDVSELQQGLETVRDEIIRGGVIAEKPSAELFALDTTGSKEIQKGYNTTHKPLKADEILAQRSAIAAVDSRKRPSSRTTDGIVEPKSKKMRVSGKELDRLRSIAYGGESVKKDVVKVNEAPSHDPWAMEEKQLDTRFSFLEEKKHVREPKTLKHDPISLAANGKPLPAVRIPEGGKSYNPAFEDWINVLTREGKKEVEAEKKRLKLAQEEQERLERAIAAAATPELLSDDGESAWESEWDGIQSEVEEDSLNTKRPERKTQAQRNKIKRRKEAERQALHEARMKERARQQTQIKALAKVVEEKEKEKAKAQALALAEQDDSSDGDELLRRRRFGKAPVPEAPLEVVLSDELQDSLRLLKPEGNLLKDRFRSMMVRGKIETRKPVSFHKQAKTTYTEKWSYKDWKLK
ncbi:P60-like protein [Lepidopterella palustris CBS 459.81]|uniref:Ribosome biogenesis protein NOP53 n=1 Tax=Lepidopterella palustris CBS 459.81 TaxID=1314670 RepID=A0A8E2EGL4_9PEZI|nr:P60-like protein [Lepidopterella palustris CBS 459.81]